MSLWDDLGRYLGGIPPSQMDTPDELPPDPDAQRVEQGDDGPEDRQPVRQPLQTRRNELLDTADRGSGVGRPGDLSQYFSGLIAPLTPPSPNASDDPQELDIRRSDGPRSERDDRLDAAVRELDQHYRQRGYPGFQQTGESAQARDMAMREMYSNMAAQRHMDDPDPGDLERARDRRLQEIYAAQHLQYDRDQAERMAYEERLRFQQETQRFHRGEFRRYTGDEVLQVDPTFVMENRVMRGIPAREEPEAPKQAEPPELGKRRMRVR